VFISGYVMEEVIIVNDSKFADLKRMFKDGGSERIHVLADFDRTLTKTFYKSEKAGSIISYLRKEKGKYLTEDYSDRAHALFDKYHPIEIDGSISQDEKNKKMYEWWKKHKELLIECGLDKQTIKRCVIEMIEEDALVFRKGVDKFFRLLENQDIPLVIITASLGDLVKGFMEQKNELKKNVHVIGNTFKFDKNGKTIGIEKIVHVFNKNEFSTEGLEVHDELLERKNVILLGDSLGDLGMVEGFEYENLIKIGFLNENVEENLEEYKKAYDVLILNDGDFEFVNDLIKEIFGD